MYVIYYTDSQQLLSEVSSKYIDLHPARKQTDMLSSMVSKMMGVQSEPQGASANAQIKIKQLPRPAAPKLKAASDKQSTTSSNAVSYTHLTLPTNREV